MRIGRNLCVLALVGAIASGLFADAAHALTAREQVILETCQRLERTLGAMIWDRSPCSTLGASTPPPPPPPATDRTAPTTPSGVVATAVSCKEVNVRWTASTDMGTGVKQYQITRGGSSAVMTVGGAFTTLNDTNLAANTRYAYTVVAVDGASNRSAASAAAAVTTPSCPITGGGGTGQVSYVANAGVKATVLKGIALEASRKLVVASGKWGTDWLLRVVDVSTQPPKLVGAAKVPGAEGLSAPAIVGSHAYVLGIVRSTSGASFTAQLIALDLRNPAQPVVASRETLPGAAASFALAAAGRYLYAAGSSAGLQVFDLADPSYPRRVGGIASGTDFADIELVGSYAYLTTRLTIYVVDVRDPSRPTVVATRGSLSKGVDGAAAGGRMNLVDGGAVMVFDISDPAKVVPLGASVAAATSVDSDSPTRAVVGHREGDFDPLLRGVSILDTTNPRQARTLQKFTTPGSVRAVISTPTAIYAADDVGLVSVIKLQ